MSGRPAPMTPTRFIGRPFCCDARHRSQSNTCYTSSVILGLGVSPMRRREFIALLGSSAVAWPLTARAQQPGRTRRIGVLMSTPADDQEGQARINAFVQSLRELGWIDGH